MKKLLLCSVVTAMTFICSMNSFAGTWKLGEGSNNTKWWYDNNDGTYAANGWYWIDGNNDGIAECYYFDKDGWMLSNTTTPDGYVVDANGAWTENGIIQTKTVQMQQQAQKNLPLSEKNGFKVGDTATMGNGEVATYMGNDEWIVSATNTKYIVTEELSNGDIWLEKVIPESEWTHVAEDYGYEIGDIMRKYHRGEDLVLEYHGNDKWKDQMGRTWTTYKHKDGSLHWSYFG